MVRSMGRPDKNIGIGVPGQLSSVFDVGSGMWVIFDYVTS